MNITWKISDLSPATPAHARAMTSLDEMEETLKPFSSAPVVKSLLTASATLREVDDEIHSALSVAVTEYYSGHSGVKSAAAKEAPTDGADPFETFWRETVLDLQERRRKQADDLAARIVEAMQNARRELDLAFSVELGPITLRTDVEVDPAKVSALRDELAVYRPSRLLQMYKGLTDDDRAITFELAAEPLLLSLSAMSVGDLGARLQLPTSANGPLPAERSAIAELQRTIQERQNARRPEWLDPAERAWATLTDAFRITIGHDVSKMSKAEYTAFKRELPAPLTPNRDWLSKALPGNPPLLQ